jgi:hypothetical protein
MPISSGNLESDLSQRSRLSLDDDRRFDLGLDLESSAAASSDKEYELAVTGKYSTRFIDDDQESRYRDAIFPRRSRWGRKCLIGFIVGAALMYLLGEWSPSASRKDVFHTVSFLSHLVFVRNHQSAKYYWRTTIRNSACEHLFWLDNVMAD